MEPISFRNVRLGGFWGERQKLNKEVTLGSVYKRFAETGRFEAFRFNWKEGDEKKPHIFWDSDVAKWIESVAYSLNSFPDKALEKQVDDVVEQIRLHQDENGYFNIYFTVCEPEDRFTNRMAHELYCAGHLTEAAVAYFEATGKRTFLDCMEKYIGYIEKVFKIDDSAKFSTPGHEEIELALVRLWQCTKKEKYLDLAEYFIDTRGTSEKDREGPFYLKTSYDQSDVPVRDIIEADGHCVRACYLYCAMADLARIKKDGKLKDACERVFDDIVKHKLYITGGIGSGIIGERFSNAFDLPNEYAYTETCAAISLALFCRRMSLLELDGRYDDVAERALYNGMLSGWSLNGRGFFYENPLEIDLEKRRATLEYRNTKEHFAIATRAEVFDCSCCPPNITRIVASFGDFLYTENENTVFVHHYASSASSFDGVEIEQKTNYPFQGSIELCIKGAKGKTVALRKPAWSASFSLKKDGFDCAAELKKGYLYVPIQSDEVVLRLALNFTPVLSEANPAVAEDAGKVALSCGPLVYCLEGIDNGALSSLAVSNKLNAAITFDETLQADVIEADGTRDADFDTLYRPAESQKEKVRLHFIPYYCFANRGESDMKVWVRKDG